MAKRISKYRANTAVRTDERVRLMSEIIAGIKIIKIYAWEKPFTKLIAIARKLEIKEIRGATYLRGIIMSFSMFSTRFSTFVSILTFVLMGNDPNAYYVFVITSFYNSLRQVLTNQLPQAMTLLAELNISVGRIQNLLQYEEIQHVVEKLEGSPNTTFLEGQKGVFMKNATAKWDLTLSDNTLSSINLKVLNGQLLAIVGTVGSGKSSLLQVILRELPLNEGEIEVKGQISYAAQEPWLLTGSIRQNILFGQPFSSNKYNNVVKACALERDFALLPFGDKSVVGERGVLLSGGQKARIGLARAVYRETDVYLLDDPLSAVDTHVGKELFDNCIKELLKEKCVILVTHQLQYLADVDNVMVLENGYVVANGPYEELEQAGYFGKLSKREEQKDESSINKDSNKVIVINQDERSDPKEAKEHRNTGKVESRIYMAYVKAGGGICVVIFSFICFLLAQVSANGADYFTTFW